MEGTPTSATLEPSVAQETYYTPAGELLVRQILAQCKPVPIEPHDYQCEGICRALDGEDVIATMATGAGKTGLLSFLMLVIRAISRDPALALGGKIFPKNPCMLVICPTKALEENMCNNMKAFGLAALVINADTSAHAREQKQNIWVQARTEPDILILSPEELSSPPFTNLLNQKPFYNRVCMLGIDEIHLLYWWGSSFRTAFQQLGLLRARLPSRGGHFIPLLGISATLRVGPTLQSIMTILGLKAGQFHFLRRSNMRHDIQISFREMQSGISGNSFPELDWLLDEEDQTVVFCKTISLGYRVACYLWHHGILKGQAKLDERLRLYNSLNWASYNLETMRFLNNNVKATITIATDVLSVGWDSRYTRNAVIFGEPSDVDEFIQKIGRIGRDRQAVSHPQAFLYYRKGAMETARRIVTEYHNPTLLVQPTNTSSLAISFKTSANSTIETMDISMAQLLLADCKPNKIDDLYNNPVEDLPCQCSRCKQNPVIKRPENCTCSGPRCQPENQLSFEFINVDSNTLAETLLTETKKIRTRRGEAITKDLRTFGTRGLLAFRQKVFREADKVAYGFYPPQIFLPDNIIKSVIDNLYSLRTVEDVSSLITDSPLLQGYHQELYDFCNDLRKKFTVLRTEAAEKKRNTVAQGVEEDVGDLMQAEMVERSEQITMRDTPFINVVSVVGDQSDPEVIEVIENSSSSAMRLRINFR